MMSLTLSNFIGAFLALSSAASAAPHLAKRNTTDELSLTTKLQLASSAIEKYQLLPNDEDFVFDFTKNQVPFANRQTFPALTGTGGAFAFGKLDACSMSFLHIHPRASELFAVTAGNVITEMVAEAGVVDAEGNQRVIRNELGPGMLTVFPGGSLHTQLNVECEPASFVASFTSEDPGAAFIVGQTFALSDDVVINSFGPVFSGQDIDAVRDALPEGMDIKIDQCLETCGIQKRQI